MPITRPPTTITSVWGDAVTAALNSKVPVFNQSTAATTGTTTELKDGGVGDLTVTVTDATAWYQIKYIARVQSTVANDVIDLHIRDGGSSSPTIASTLIAAGSQPVPAVAGAGATNLTVESYVQFTVGTHILAGFYTRTAGTGSVSVAQATGAQRVLSVAQVS